MGFFNIFVWLAEMAYSPIRSFWYVSVALILMMAVAARFAFPFLPSRFRAHHLLMLAPLAFPLLILCVGALMFREDFNTHSRAPAWPELAIHVLLFAQMAMSITVVIKLKGYRWFTSAVVGLEMWVGLCCGFISVMSVTGVWL